MAKPVEKPKRSEGAKRQRSPNYPAVGLRNALERVGRLYKADGKPGSIHSAAMRHIGFSSAHGQAHAVMSALKKFGLVEEKAGRIVPSKLAVDVLEFPVDHPRHVAALKEMALKPSIYAEIVESFREHAQLPSDASLKPELVTDKHFNPKAVDGFLRDFRDTLEFAGILVGNMLNLSGLENSRQPIGEHDTPPISSMAAKPAHVTGMDITPPLASRPISLLVGFSDDGQPIYAHIAFDVPVRKGYLSRLGDQLKAMESVAESTAKQK